MSDGKLLHERLREWARKAECADRFPTTIACDEMVDTSYVRTETECELFRKFADEIERCYMPIPVDENGELWKIDDPCIAYGDETSVCGYGRFGGVFVFDEDKSMYNIVHPERLKRLVSEALDADGMPINVGDTVWDYEGDGPFKVDNISGMDFNGQPFIHMDGHDVRSYYASDTLTHREPDSLEKLLNDMSEYSSEHVMPGSDFEKTLDVWIERTAVLVEKGNEKL